MAYESITLQEVFQIDEIVSIHYFEYMSDFSFPGESHNFWEFLCVDKGVVNITADTTDYLLEHGDIIFHKPNEFHNVFANGRIAPNLMVMSFYCLSPAMDFFQNKILRLGEIERTLLAHIISEAQTAFDCRLDDTYSEKLIRSDISNFGSEQLIKLYLQQFLIQLTRANRFLKATPILSKSIKKKQESELFQKVVRFMEENICMQLTIQELCKKNLIGRSILQKLFREYANSGVIDYFSTLKINYGKQLIREQQLNFTQIAEHLGYTSVHYFSRQFKNITGMTPSEYAFSIKLLSEGT